MEDLVLELQDYRHLDWAQRKMSPGTPGCFLKAYEEKDGIRIYYKLSNYDSYRGVYGHENVNELIVSRLLNILGIPHVRYRLIHARLLMDDQELDTWIGVSLNFRNENEEKIAFDAFFDMEGGAVRMSSIWRRSSRRIRSAWCSADGPVGKCCLPDSKRRRNLLIRRLEKADIDRVAQIWLDTNRQAHAFIPARYWEEHLEEVKGLFALAELYVYEEKAGGPVLGFVGLDGDYIAGIFVERQAQSRGIGRQLLDFVKGIRTNLYLGVYQKNRRAVQFYEREGFRIQQAQVDGDTGEGEYRMTWGGGR